MADADQQTVLEATVGPKLRRQLEEEWRALGKAAPAPRAGLAAARVAALTAVANGAKLPEWLVPLAAALPPKPEQLRVAWEAFGQRQAIHTDDVGAILTLWPLLIPTEAIMATGGDSRLQVDPHTKLNGYGAGHQPRPGAVSYASSTASSISERGYAAAEAARRFITAAMLQSPNDRSIASQLSAIRLRLAHLFALGPDYAVVLAASGTDTELLALALSHLAAPDQPVLSILVAPEETGSGVPIAVLGRHFSVDTAQGRAVVRESPLEGFRTDTELATVALRDPLGVIRPILAVEAEIAAKVAAGLAAGRRVVLHAVDLSKTGLLAPRPAFLHNLRAFFGSAFDIVVDACQLRLSPESVRHYLALDAAVLITGSKFLTGPPFSGALLLPPCVAARMDARVLPLGLAAYLGREEFPDTSFAAQHLPPTGNYGLALRWVAALAEFEALLQVRPEQQADIMAAFGRTVMQAAEATPGVRMLDHVSHERGPHEHAWERLRSVFGFALSAPFADRWLNPSEAREVYRWLNADLSAVLPHLPPTISALICHIGQPVALPQFDGACGQMGVLRIACDARLIAGEPSHYKSTPAQRLEYEFADVRMIFRKISVILDNWDTLAAAN